jgi:hypothetical protein
MATTIQVREVTKQRLDLLKEKLGASSYDEVISRITSKELGVPKSMFGSMKGLGPWTKADRMRFRHERDD